MKTWNPIGTHLSFLVDEQATQLVRLETHVNRFHVTRFETFDQGVRAALLPPHVPVKTYSWNNLNMVEIDEI